MLYSIYRLVVHSQYISKLGMLLYYFQNELGYRTSVSIHDLKQFHEEKKIIMSTGLTIQQVFMTYSEWMKQTVSLPVI